jgi:hypothetical protein
MSLLKEVERICRELGNKDGLRRTLGNQAILLAANLGRAAETLPLADEALKLARELGMPAAIEQNQKVLNYVRSKLR